MFVNSNFSFSFFFLSRLMISSLGLCFLSIINNSKVWDLVLLVVSPAYLLCLVSHMGCLCSWCIITIQEMIYKFHVCRNNGVPAVRSLGEESIFPLRDLEEKLTSEMISDLGILEGLVKWKGVVALVIIDWILMILQLLFFPSFLPTHLPFNVCGTVDWTQCLTHAMLRQVLFHWATSQPFFKF